MKLNYYIPRDEFKQEYISHFLYYKIVNYQDVIAVYEHGSFNCGITVEGLFLIEGYKIRRADEEEIALL